MWSQLWRSLPTSRKGQKKMSAAVTKGVSGDQYSPTKQSDIPLWRNTIVADQITWRRLHWTLKTKAWQQRKPRAVDSLRISRRRWTSSCGAFVRDFRASFTFLPPQLLSDCQKSKSTFVLGVFIGSRWLAVWSIITKATWPPACHLLCSSPNGSLC